MNLTLVTLHGDLGKKFGKEFKLKGNSVSKLLRGLFMNTKDKLKMYLLEKDSENVRYKLIINGREYEKDFDEEKIESISKSSMTITRQIKTLDIVPIIQGAQKFVSAILGITLIIVGIATGTAAFLVPAGIGLIASSVIQLLTKAPKFEDFREIDGQTGRTSYLFNGPQNVTREGGPVPIIYGQLLVGSQVISASYKIDQIDATPKNS